MPADFPQASKETPELSGAARIGRLAAVDQHQPTDLRHHDDEHAELDATAARRWRRWLIAINVVAWILIILGIRLLFH